MKRTLCAVGLGALCLTWVASAGATVLCAKKSGVVVVRAACKKKETPLNLTQFGAVSLPCASQVGTEVFFTGCNVNIRSGSGSTDGAVNGLGNLIVGYNANTGGQARTGSHNLIVGDEHDYSNYGGLVAGFQNTIAAPSASVSGGAHNTASGPVASVSGGNLNTASGTAASVSGGDQGMASGPGASVSGGVGNLASGFEASVSGGEGNAATGIGASVSGGETNRASGTAASVSGGFMLTQPVDAGWAAGSVSGNAIAGDFESP